MNHPTPHAQRSTTATDPESKTPPDATGTSVQRSVDTTRKEIPPNGSAQGEDGSVPLMPHERDQSVGMTDGAPDANVEQAYRDVKRGLQDTDRGKPAHEAYQRQK